MHSESDNIGIMTYDKVDEFVEQLFEKLLSRYYTELEISIKGND